MTSSMLGTRISEGAVRAEWIDVNQHMNVAYYVLAFDLGIDALWDRFGITDEYIGTARCSTFAVESHVLFQRELHEADAYIVTAQVLAFDEKRVHQFQRIYHAEKHFLAATAEWMNLHVSLETRRVCPWPASVLGRISRFAGVQAGQSRPAEAGKQMSIPKPLYSL